MAQTNLSWCQKDDINKYNHSVQFSKKQFICMEPKEIGPIQTQL